MEKTKLDDRTRDCTRHPREHLVTSSEPIEGCHLLGDVTSAHGRHGPHYQHGSKEVSKFLFA